MRGHQSLVRLIGKRRRSLSVRNAAPAPSSALPCRHDSVDEAAKAVETSIPDGYVECPVCGDEIIADNAVANDHLDHCLANGRKRCKQVQLTLLPPAPSDVSPENENLEVQGEPVEASRAGCCLDDQLPKVGGDGAAESVVCHTLVTQVAGRRFYKEARCVVGMEISVQREPENVEDPQAIKVLDSSDQVPLGHLPRNVALHLSPLLDEGVLRIQGHISRLSAHSFGVAGLSLQLQVQSSHENKLLNSLEEIKCTAARYKGREQNFLCLLDTVLNRDFHLFAEDESAFLGAFRTLSANSQRLFVRLSQRKGPWFRVGSLSYEDVEDVKSAVQELADEQYFILGKLDWLERNANEASEMLEVLTLQELRELCHRANLMKRSQANTMKKEDLKATLGSVLSNSLISGRKAVLEWLIDMAGLCIRISDSALFLLWRLQRLFFLNGEQELQVFLLVDIGRAKYPSYNCIRTMPVFASRQQLLSYEQALQVAQVVDMALEADDLTTLHCSLEKACSELELAGNTLDHSFLSRFSASWVYATVCTLAVSVYERERRYPDAINLLRKLLATSLCPGRRGHWVVRLSMDLEHLGRPEESLEVAEQGLKDPCVRGGDRISLQRRVLRLGKPPRRWKVPAYAAMMKQQHKVVKITGRPLNSVVGMKSRFYGYSGDQCSVEELALQYYASDEGGGWKGVHSEGGVWLTLFGLLMWDIFFSDVPDVFQTPFQTAPLDLDTDAFYPARSLLIDSRLEIIRQGSAVEIIRECWSQHHGTLCRGVNWDKYALDELQDIAICVGGPGLSRVCKLLAEDHASWTSGMPDLLLWRSGQNTGSQAKLVEVKGPGDRLSEQQVAWFLILSDAGVDVELCKVAKQ